MKNNIPDPPRELPRIIKEGKQPIRFNNEKVDKKPFWNTTVGKIVETLGLFALKAFIKNRTGIKNTPNAGRIDDVFDKINKN